MTDTEKILSLIEMNDEIPALVTDGDRRIISGNNAWLTNFGQIEMGQSFNKLFDTNTSLLIKNSFIDANIFQKIQRREIQFLAGNKTQDFNLLLSPFSLDSKSNILASRVSILVF